MALTREQVDGYRRDGFLSGIPVFSPAERTRFRETAERFRTEQEIARVPPEAIVAAGRAIMGPGAEALFISCTGLQGHAAIATLEAATGRPVVTSNQAQVWEALSLLRYGRPVHGYGRLLATLAPARAA